MIEVIPNWHPVAVHFTVALLFTASALFVLGAVLRHRPLGAAATLVARWNLALGVLAAVLTLATGWQAYNSVSHDVPSHANMTVHLRWAIGSAAVFAAAAAAAWFDRKRVAGAGGALLVLLVAGSGGLAVTGWLGGENVYRYGLGVMSLPKTDGHAHPGAGSDHVDDGHRHPEPVPAEGRDPGKAPDGVSGKGAAASSKASSPPVNPPAAPSDGHAHSH